MNKYKMVKKYIVIVVILILINVCVASSNISIKVQSLIVSSNDKNIFYVDDNYNESTPGWNVTHFNKIKNGINAADEGDTIKVYSGDYYERPRIHKQLIMEGIQVNGENNPLIIGGKEDDTVVIYADGCIFENFRVKNGFGGYGNDGITLHSDNNIIRNCYSFDTGTGLVLSTSNNNTITNNTMTGGWNGIKISGVNNTFSNNKVYAHNSHEIQVGGQFNYFYNNTASRCKTGNGFEVYGDNCVFSGNIIDSNSRKGIHLAKSYNNTLVNNKFINNGILITGDAIEYWSTHKIENNKVNNKHIYFYINKNNFTVPFNVGQIFLVNCSYFIIKNLVFGKSDTCINLKCSSYNTIKENKFLSTSADEGVYLSNSHNNDISDNVFFSLFKGLYLQESDNNRIIGNVIQDCHKGIVIEENSDNNEIFLNDFLNFFRNDHINAEPYGGINIWDNGEKGNYWCDYWWRYPWASIVWGKGIYNIPYVLDDENVDHYPLVRPSHKYRYRQSNYDLSFYDFFMRFLDMFPLLQKILNHIL